MQTELSTERSTDGEGRVVIDGHRVRKGEPIADPPDDVARRHVVGHERGIAAGDEQELPGAPHAVGRRATAGVAPAYVARDEIERRDAAVALRDDEELRQSGRVHHGARRAARGAGRDAGRESDLAGLQITQQDLAVGFNARDA